ncbi:unnamed protein product [Closterium sp. NIES-54]
MLPSSARPLAVAPSRTVPDLATLHRLYDGDPLPVLQPDLGVRTVLDAGAGAGILSVLLACVYPTAVLVTTEASESGFRALSLNTAPYDNAIALRAALWSHVTSLVLQADGGRARFIEVEQNACFLWARVGADGWLRGGVRLRCGCSQVVSGGEDATRMASMLLNPPFPAAVTTQSSSLLPCTSSPLPTHPLSLPHLPTPPQPLTTTPTHPGGFTPQRVLSSSSHWPLRLLPPFHLHPFPPVSTPLHPSPPYSTPSQAGSLLNASSAAAVTGLSGSFLLQFLGLRRFDLVRINMEGNARVLLNLHAPHDSMWLLAGPRLVAFDSRPEILTLTLPADASPSSSASAARPLVAAFYGAQSPPAYQEVKEGIGAEYIVFRRRTNS